MSKPVERSGELARNVLSYTREHAWHLLVAFFVVAAALPTLGLPEGYYMTVLSELFIFAVLALSWDLLGGQTGYPSFGNMAFFGVGAYTTAILVKDFGTAFPAAFLAAGVVAVVFAAIIGLMVLRLRGHYFAIATLGVLLAATQISRNLEITGGASGKIILTGPSGTTFYYVFLGVLVVEIAVVLSLSRTRFGYTLNAIRDDEGKATAMGVNTTYFKTAAWTLSALFTGLVGGAWGVWNTFIDPATAYNTAWNVELIAMALVGGTGTIAGPVLGAFALTLAIFVIDSTVSGWQLIVLGIVVIVTVISFPEGAVGALRERASTLEYYRHGGQAAGEASDEAAGDASASDADESDPSEGSIRTDGGQSVVRTDGITKRFGGLTALDHVDVRVDRGEIVGLIGPNGSGKTTLFNCVTGAYEANEGDVFLDGRTITDWSEHRIAQSGLVRMFQHTRIYGGMTVEQNLLVSAHQDDSLGRLFSRPSEAAREKATELLDYIGLRGVRDVPAGRLSFGQQKLVEFAMALIADPDVLLMDEPAGGINPSMIRQLLDYIREANDEEDVTIFLIEHNMDFVMEIADRIYVLAHGEKIAEGTPEQIQTDERVLDAYLGRER